MDAGGTDNLQRERALDRRAMGKRAHLNMVMLVGGTGKISHASPPSRDQPWSRLTASAKRESHSIVNCRDGLSDLVGLVSKWALKEEKACKSPKSLIWKGERVFPSLSGPFTYGRSKWQGSQGLSDLLKITQLRRCG